MWYEDVRELLRYHNEQMKKFGKHRKVLGGYRGQNRGWSVRQTAIANNISVGKCSEDLALAKALKDYPNIKNLLERKDALTFMRLKNNE